MASGKINKELLSEDFRQYLDSEYTNGSKSIPEIAKEKGTYANKVYRAMKKLGVPRKDRAEAQKLVLKTGKAKHPTEGTVRPPKVKRQIGRSVFKKNMLLSDEERQARVEKSKELWNNIPEETRKDYTKRSHKATRTSGKKGSAFERHMVAALLGHKYKVETHWKLNFAESEMTVDIFLPVEGICIEIDGPVHFEPIFGEANLERQLNADLKKNTELIAEGYSLIRIQNPRGYTSMSFVETFIEKFIPFLKEVATLKTNSFHEICVDDDKYIV